MLCLKKRMPEIFHDNTYKCGCQKLCGASLLIRIKKVIHA